MNIEDVRQAVTEAKSAFYLADQNTEAMVGLIVGRLHHVKSYRGRRALSDLKRELRDFNIHTGEWKN